MNRNLYRKENIMSGVYDKKTLIGLAQRKEKNLLEHLRDEQADVHKKRAGILKNLAFNIRAYVNAMTPHLPDPTLLSAMEDAVGRDLRKEFRKAACDNIIAGSELIVLEHRNGSHDTINKQYAAIHSTHDIATAQAMLHRFDMNERRARLKLANDFDAKAESKNLPTLDNDLYFKRGRWGHIAGLVFESHYRQGHRILSRYKAEDASIRKDRAEQASDTRALKAVESRLRLHDNLREIKADMDDKKKQILPAAQLRDGLQKSLADVLCRREVFDAVAQRMGPAFPPALLQAQAEADKLLEREKILARAIKTHKAHTYHHKKTG
jgi:hypothetical protein